MQDTLASSDQPAEPTSPRPDPADARPLLGRFVLRELLGEGGMGVVYTAFDELLGRTVALKMIRAERAGAVAMARILREARALARISHPNVVQLHDVCAVDGQIFLEMEYVPGPTLRAWLDEHGRSRGEILEHFAAAGRGLAAAHAAALVHRDFKPDFARPSQPAPQPTGRIPTNWGDLRGSTVTW